MKRSAFASRTKVTRSRRGTDESSSLVMSTWWRSLFPRWAFNLLAISSVISFSLVPIFPIVPESVPPCPASIMIVLIFRPSMRMRDTLGLFIRALNSEVFTVSSEETPGAGRRGYLLISGVSSVETPGEGGETGCALIFAVGSAGANELPVYWSCIKTAKTQSTADKRILLRRKGFRRDRAGRPLPSMRRFCSYTPRRMS